MNSIFKWMVSVLRINEKIVLLNTISFKWMMQKLKRVGCLIFFLTFSWNH